MHGLMHAYCFLPTIITLRRHGLCIHIASSPLLGPQAGRGYLPMLICTTMCILRTERLFRHIDPFTNYRDPDKAWVLQRQCFPPTMGTPIRQG